MQTKRIDELEKELISINNLSKSAAQQSIEFSKMKSESNKETIRLLQEIDIAKENVSDSAMLTLTYCVNIHFIERTERRAGFSCEKIRRRERTT